MKTLLSGTVLSALLMLFPVSSMAGVSVGISISLPPPIEFVAPPEVVVIPGTYVYGVPDVNVDIFFHDGWWWRLWEGRWYRSLNYNSGWGYYQGVPYFYREVPLSWRNDYREHRWNERHPVQAVQPHQYRPQSQTYTSHTREVTRPEQFRPQPRDVRPQQSQPQPQSMTSHIRQAPTSPQTRPQEARLERGNGKKHDRT